MKVVINAFANIERDLEKAYSEEVKALEQSIEQQKKELEEQQRKRLAEQVSRINESAEKQAALEKQRGLARTLAMVQQNVLVMKKEQVETLRTAMNEGLSHVDAQKKSRYISKLVEQLLKETDEPAILIEVPKGVTVAGKKVKDSLGEFGVVVQIESGARVRKIVELSDQELAKVLLSEGVWAQL